VRNPLIFREPEDVEASQISKNYRRGERGRVRALTHSLLWLGRKLMFLLSLALGTLMLVLLPTMLTLREPPKPFQKPWRKGSCCRPLSPRSR
jgi:hypothetical protein